MDAEQEPAAATPRTLRAFRAAERLPLGVGRAIFSRAVRLAAPYFLTIPARVELVEPGRARVSMRQLPWLRNHIGTIHAIALCNLAELAMGMVAEATVPPSHRWLPKGMTVEYLAKARRGVTASATLELSDPAPDGAEVPVRISIVDREGQEVLTGEIRIWVTVRP